MASLKRPKQPMPDFVRDALRVNGLEAAYAARPPYQRNDHLMWINTAKQEATQQRRMEKMLVELAQGHGYMGMTWRGQSPA